MTNADIKYLKSLQQKKYRDLNRSFLVEGPKLIKEIIENNVPIKKGFYTEEAPDFLKKEAYFQIKKAEMQRISGLKNPSNCMAELAFFGPEDLPLPKGEFFLGLDRIQDPGNLGSIIRICDWFGIEHIICSPDTCDLYNPKVVQATMGAIFRVSLHYTNLEEYCNNLIKNEIEIFSSSLEGKGISGPCDQKEGLLLIGNEGNGISQELLDLSSKKVKIKGYGKAESLNAAVATGILVNWLKSAE